MQNLAPLPTPSPSSDIASTPLEAPEESTSRALLAAGRAAGLAIRDNREPATVKRLRQLLRRAGITGTEEAVGCSLVRFLELNPRLPLWAATALVLEAVLN